MSGQKGRSGRRPQWESLAAGSMQLIERNLSGIFQVLIDKALAGNAECAIYLVDRKMGRPRQEIDARIRSVISFTPDDYELMGRVRTHKIAVEPIPLLTEPNNNINNEVLQDITLNQAQSGVT